MWTHVLGHNAGIVRHVVAVTNGARNQLQEEKTFSAQR